MKYIMGFLIIIIQSYIPLVGLLILGMYRIPIFQIWLEPGRTIPEPEWVIWVTQVNVKR